MFSFPSSLPLVWHQISFSNLEVFWTRFITSLDPVGSILIDRTHWHTKSFFTKMRNRREVILWGFLCFLKSNPRHGPVLTCLGNHAHYVFCLLFKPVILNVLQMFLSNAKLILHSKDTCNPETKKKMFMWLRCIFIEFLAGQGDAEERSPASGVYNGPFWVVWNGEGFISTTKPVRSGPQMAGICALSHICLLLLRQNFEVKCVNNMEGSKCLRLMFSGKSREGTFCSRFFEKLLHLLQIDIVTQDKGFSLCCFL